MLDAARQFYTIDQLKDFVDSVNAAGGQFLHLRLSDDQNYLLESELLGQTPEYATQEPDGTLRHKVFGNRFYSKAQINDLLGYARSRGVEIIPEITFPGHVSFIHKLLKHEDIVRASQVFRDNRDNSNANMGSASGFVMELYSEAAAPFKAGGSKHFHMGGHDFEGAIANAEAYTYYLNGVGDYVMNHIGLTPQVWNDGIMTARLPRLNKFIEITYRDWDGDAANADEREANLANRATVGELVKAGFKVMNYNQRYLAHHIAANSEAQASGAVQRLRDDEWHLGIWDENNKTNAVDERQMKGAAVALWNDPRRPATVDTTQLRQWLRPQLEWVNERVRKAAARP